MLDNWQTIFGNDLNRSARNFVSQALDARNAWAHANGPLNAVETVRALDAVAETLNAIAAKPLAGQVRSLYDEQIRAAGPGIAATSEPSAQGDLLTVSPAAARLKPWREVAIPHPRCARKPIQGCRVCRRSRHRRVGPGGRRVPAPLRFLPHYLLDQRPGARSSGVRARACETAGNQRPWPADKV